ncbi:4'-phosphopantetheinyl transferase family protein [Streptomyces sp. NPDC093060]|uniref:4'-phosphopantetheinyl transferase family protein n=1 Tax=Streptomyces sp. NPDC093060 TaxID=3366019 RepID=UPI003819CD03
MSGQAPFPRTDGPPDPPRLTVRWGPAPDGDERVATHAALVAAAAELTGGPAHRIRVMHDPEGRPRLTGPAAAVKVSLSHAPGVFAVVLGQGPAEVGVDIEPVRPRPAAALARRWLDPGAAAWVEGLPGPARVEAFLALWTRKEAAGKAYGHGLRQGGLHRPVPLVERWPLPECTEPFLRLTDPPGTTTTVVADAGAVRAVVSVVSVTPESSVRPS